MSYRSDAERLKALNALLGTEPPVGLKGAEILEWTKIQAKGSSRVLVLIAYISTLLTVCVIVGLAINNARSAKDHLPPELVNSSASRPK